MLVQFKQLKDYNHLNTGYYLLYLVYDIQTNGPGHLVDVGMINLKLIEIYISQLPSVCDSLYAKNKNKNYITKQNPNFLK